MPGEALAQAFVEIVPDVSKFGPNVETAIRKAATGAQTAADKAFRGVGDSADASAARVDGAFRDSHGRFAKTMGSIESDARAAGDHVGKAMEDAGGRGRKSFSDMETSSRGAIGGIASSLKTLALGAGAFIIGEKAISLAKDIAAQARESNKVDLVTQATLKATGSAAGLTATQISNLATAISNKTGIDDEAIQTAENQLLTFKSIHNAVGANNDIFNRATQAAVDLSAHGFGDLGSTSIQLGKALEDPVKGITALARSGVTFTAQQKEQIKTLVASGKTLDAQKIILAAVEGQVGGTAAAIGTSSQKFKVMADNVKEAIGKRVLPLVDKLADWGVRVMPHALDVVMHGFDVLGKDIGLFSRVFKFALDPSHEMINLTGLADVAYHLGKVFETVKDGVMAFFGAFKNGDITTSGDKFVGVMERLGDLGHKVFDVLRDDWDKVLGLFRSNDAGASLDKVGGFLSTLFTVVSKLLDYLDAHPRTVAILVETIAGLMVASAAAGAVDSLGTSIFGLPGKLVGAESGLGKLVGHLSAIKAKVFSVKAEGVDEAEGKVKTLQEQIDALKDKTVKVSVESTDSSTKDAESSGKNLGSSAAKGIVSGIAGGIGGLIATTLPETVLPAIGTALAGVGTVIVGIIGSPVVIGLLIAAAAAAATALIVHFRQPILDFFENTLPRLVGEALGALAGVIFLSFVGLPALIIRTLVQQGPGIVEAAAGLLATVFSTAASGLASFFSALPGAIASFFSALPGVIAGIVEGVIGFFKRLPGEIPGLASAAVNGIVGFFSALPGNIASFFSSIFGTITSTLGSIVSAIVSSPIGSVVSTVVNGIIGGFSHGWDLVNQVTGGALNAIAGVIRGAWDGFVGIVHTGIDKIVDVMRGIAGRVEGVVSGAFDGIKNAFRGAVNWVIDKWNSLKFPSISIGPFHTPEIGTPNIPRLASGSIIDSPTLAWIGENAKREVVIPLSDPARALELTSESGLFDVLAKALSSRGGVSAVSASTVAATAAPQVNVTIAPGAVQMVFAGAQPTEDEARRLGAAAGETLADTLAQRQIKVAGRVA